MFLVQIYLLLNIMEQYLSLDPVGCHYQISLNLKKDFFMKLDIFFMGNPWPITSIHSICLLWVN